MTATVRRLLLIADVRRAVPAASITVAARASIAPLFAMAPDVDETLILAGGEVETLAARRFDTALLLPNSARAAIVARCAGVAERWGYRTGWRGSLLTRAMPVPRGVHQIEYYQHLVRALGFPSGPSEPRVVERRPVTTTASAPAKKKRSLEKEALIIGGSAGAGAAIGAAAGGGKGAAIGALSGGVAGLVYDLATRKK